MGPGRSRAPTGDTTGVDIVPLSTIDSVTVDGMIADESGTNLRSHILIFMS